MLNCIAVTLLRCCDAYVGGHRYSQTTAMTYLAPLKKAVVDDEGTMRCVRCVCVSVCVRARVCVLCVVVPSPIYLVMRN